MGSGITLYVFQTFRKKRSSSFGLSFTSVYRVWSNKENPFSIMLAVCTMLDSELMVNFIAYQWTQRNSLEEDPLSWLLLLFKYPRGSYYAPCCQNQFLKYLFANLHVWPGFLFFIVNGFGTYYFILCLWGVLAELHIKNFNSNILLHKLLCFG